MGSVLSIVLSISVGSGLRYCPRGGGSRTGRPAPKPHAFGLAEGLPPDALFALAELSFLRAEDTGQQEQYAASVVYAYALLFSEGERAPLDPLDPRERISADL